MGDGAGDLRVAGVEDGFLIGLVIRKSGLALQRPSIELMYRNCREVDAFETPKVDCSHTMALGVYTLAVRVDTASGAETVFDDVLVECISACGVFGSEQGQIVPGDEPEQ